MKLYAVSAAIDVKSGPFTKSHYMPTFLVNGEMAGACSEDEVERFVRKMIADLLAATDSAKARDIFVSAAEV